MISSYRGMRGALALAAASLLWALPTSATIVDFNSLPVGQVVAGEAIGGGPAPSGLFLDFELAVTNLGGGPSSLVIFDSSNPTADDADLGTPNQAFGGPGIGAGGAVSNNVSLGNLLIIAENIDDAGEDGLVDAPDDESGGGIIEFFFHEPSVIFNITLLDIDAESAVLILVEETLDRGEVEALDLGENSVQHFDLSTNGPVTHLKLIMSGSGAIGGLEYYPASVATDANSWGGVKSQF